MVWDIVHAEVSADCLRLRCWEGQVRGRDVHCRAMRRCSTRSAVENKRQLTVEKTVPSARQMINKRNGICFDRFIRSIFCGSQRRRIQQCRQRLLQPRSADRLVQNRHTAR